MADSRSEELTDGQETPFLPPSLPPSAAKSGWDVLQKLCGQLARATQQLADCICTHFSLLKVVKIGSEWQLPLLCKSSSETSNLPRRLLLPLLDSIFVAPWATHRYQTVNLAFALNTPATAVSQLSCFLFV